MTRITVDIRKRANELLQNGESFTSICKKLGISRPTLIKIRKSLNENVNENVNESGNEAGSESESLQSETETLPREILLRGRYQTESESESEHESLHEQNDAIHNYLSRMKSEPIQEPIQARTPIQKPIQTSIQKPESQAQSESKQARITKITAYFRAFPMKVSPITAGVPVETYIQNLQAKNDEELNGILSAIRYRISNSGLSDGAHLGFIAAARGVENIGCQFGLKLQGYADSLTTNQNIRDILTEMSIEYLSEVALAPHKRLLLICGLQAYSIHTKNSTEDLLKNVLNQEVDESKFDSKLNDKNEDENEF